MCQSSSFGLSSPHIVAEILQHLHWGNSTRSVTACREALEKQLGAVQDADVVELLASVARLRVSPHLSVSRSSLKHGKPRDIQKSMHTDTLLIMHLGLMTSSVWPERYATAVSYISLCYLVIPDWARPRPYPASSLFQPTMEGAH